MLYKIATFWRSLVCVWHFLGMYLASPNIQLSKHAHWRYRTVPCRCRPCLLCCLQLNKHKINLNDVIPWHFLALNAEKNHASACVCQLRVVFVSDVIIGVNYVRVTVAVMAAASVWQLTKYPRKFSNFSGKSVFWAGVEQFWGVIAWKNRENGWTKRDKISQVNIYIFCMCGWHFET